MSAYREVTDPILTLLNVAKQMGMPQAWLEKVAAMTSEQARTEAERLLKGGRLLEPACVKCGSTDVRVCEPDMCGPCYIAASCEDDDE